MRNRLLVVGAIVLVVCSGVASAQSTQPQQATAAKGEKPAPAPAPPRDLSGIWDAGRKGILPNAGSKAAPMTTWGQERFNANKPGYGPREVPVGLTNDPLDTCDPAGFPRDELFELRMLEIAQTPTHMLILYQYQRAWRVIWTDGRELPKDLDSRWYGYSVGKWETDDTFVVQSNGTEERTWLDDEGDPHSDELRVEERFHRVDHDTLELTVTIDDPKAYTKPWVAVNKAVLNLRPPTTDIMEMICVPSEVDAYKKSIADPAAAGTTK